MLNASQLEQVHALTKRVRDNPLEAPEPALRRLLHRAQCQLAPSATVA
jgi:hypothetical protein